LTSGKLKMAAASADDDGDDDDDDDKFRIAGDGRVNSAAPAVKQTATSEPHLAPTLSGSTLEIFEYLLKKKS